MIPPSTGTPSADFWCSRLDNGADMNHPPSFCIGSGFFFDGPSFDRPIGRFGRDLGLDLRPSAMVVRQ